MKKEKTATTKPSLYARERKVEKNGEKWRKTEEKGDFASSPREGEKPFPLLLSTPSSPSPSPGPTPLTDASDLATSSVTTTAAGVLTADTLTWDSSTPWATATPDPSVWTTSSWVYTAPPAPEPSAGGLRVADLPPDLLSHISLAVTEGLRKDIEMDTIVIDESVAFSSGANHADMILGLKVKYAKEGSLPLGSAFVILKDSKKKPVSRKIKAKEDVLPF